MTTLIPLFIQGSALGINAGAAPGPMQAYLISETLAGGWRRSLPLIFVPLISDIPIVVVTTFILKQFPESVLQVISLIGGLFIFYLAWGFWKQLRETHQHSNTSQKISRRSFSKAVAMNLLNPNPYIFWAFVSGPILINAIDQSWLHALAFLAGFYGVFMLTMLAFIIIFHQTRLFGPKVVRSIQLFSIIVLVVFGALLVYQGLFRLL
jgi:threonine/homoserine/homoserine lactone efflux protein